MKPKKLKAYKVVVGGVADFGTNGRLCMNVPGAYIPAPVTVPAIESSFTGLFPSLIKLETICKTRYHQLPRLV